MSCLIAYEVKYWKENSWIKLLFWFYMLIMTLFILCHKVQIVLGSQLILEIHPLEFVRTSLYYCQNIRKTV